MTPYATSRRISGSRGAGALLLAGVATLATAAQADHSTPVADADADAATVRHQPVPTASITASVEDGGSQVFDQAALAKLPQHRVRAEAHGKVVECVGPNLIDLLAATGAPTGEALRGKNLSLYVRIGAADGYRVVFALAELDPAMRSDVPIVTASCDDQALDAKDGPFRLVAPGERRPARWVRQVTQIDLVRAP